MQKFTKSDYLPVFVACLSLFALGWMDNARGPFFPFFLEASKESASKGALFFAVTSFITILSSATADWILKKWGLKTLLLLGGFGMGSSPLGLILFPNLNGALITAFLFGAGLGWTTVGQNILINLVKAVELRRQFFALLHCFYALAAMTAPLTILKLKNILPWNWLLIGVFFLSCPFVISLFFLKKEGAEIKVKKMPPPPLSDFWVMIWVTFLSFYIASELIMSTRLVVFLKGLGLSFKVASQHLFLFFLAMFLIRLLFFFVSFHISALKILLTCLFASLGLMFLGYNVSTYFFSLMGASFAPVFPIVMDEISNMWPKRFDVLIARIIAISSMFVVSIHMLVGKLTDLYGIDKAMYSVPILMLFSLIILLTAVAKKRQIIDRLLKK